MSRDKIWHLFARKLAGEASKEELHELDLLLKEDSSLYYELSSLIQVWDEVPAADNEFLEATYLLHYEKMKKLGVEPKQEEQEEETENYSRPFTIFTRYRNKVFAGAVAATLVILGLVVVFNNSQKENASLVLYPDAPKPRNEIVTKTGSNAQFKLPDGSTVWLNAGSKLNYEKINETGIREVYLTGEAFFDVVKNPKRPFIIHTSSIDIKVLGTAFNVKAYPDDKTVETSLIRGSVEVTVKNNPGEKYLLKPNQKLVLYNAYINDRVVGKAQRIVPVNLPAVAIKQLSYINGDSTSNEISWMRNELAFEDESFADIAKRMERWYGVEFEFRNMKIEQERITGSFEMETLAQALEALKFTTKFDYKIEGKKVLIF
ncbi:MAG: FecR family protein [Lacibacter sp.]